MNSLLFIRDSEVDDPPYIDGIGAIWSTASCVAVGCLPDCDGETKVTIGEAAELETTDNLIFDRELETPSKKIIVDTVLDEKILEHRVKTSKT